MKSTASNLLKILLWCTYTFLVISSGTAYAQLPNFTTPKNFSVLSNSPLSGKRSNVMIATSDGGVLRSGIIDSNNAIVSKISSLGNVEWETVLNKDSSADVTTLSEVEGGKYLACGYIYTSGNFQFQNGGIRYAVLLNNKGNILWKMPIDTSLDRPYMSVYNPIIKCANELYTLLTIKFANYETYNILPTLRFYNANGNIVKEIFYDSLHSESMYIHPFFQTKDNGFVALIHCELGATTFYQLWRLDSIGNILWKKQFTDVPYSRLSYYSSVVETSDGGFFVATTAPVNFPDTTYIILRRFDSLGNEFIKKKYGVKRFNAVGQIQQTPNQDVIMIGYSRDSSQYSGADMCIFRVSSTGKLRWQESFGDSTTGDYGESIAVIDDHTFYIGGGTGKTEDPYSGTRPIVFKISDIATSVSEQPDDPDGIHLFPNPTSTQFTLSGVDGVASVRVVNALGEEVKQFTHVSSQYSIDVSDLGSGLYFVSIRTAKGAVVKPMMVSR